MRGFEQYMNKEKYIALKHRFHDYVSTFCDNSNKLVYALQEKLEHIHRVANNCVFIAKELGLKENEIYMAEICGLYHDIGRFSQFKEYNTLDDSKSVNHGLQGFKTIILGNMLSVLPENEACIILNSVRFHNARNVPVELTSDSIFYTNIVRDADKLDIIEIVNDAITSKAILNDKSTVWNLEFGRLNPEISKSILNNKSANYSDVINATDVCFLQLSWIFEINFKPVLHRLIKIRAIGNLANAIISDENSKNAIEHLKIFLTS